LVIELAGESNDFVDEYLPPDRELGQMNVLVSDFWEVIIETDSFGIPARGDEPDLEMRLSPNHGIESRPVRRVLDERNTRIVFPDEQPKGPTKFFCIALLAELIDEIVMFALAFPGLDHATTRVNKNSRGGGARSMIRTDKNSIIFDGDLRLSDIRSAIACIYQLSQKLAYQDIVLDFRRATYVDANLMLPLSSYTDFNRKHHIDFLLIEPADGTLRRLFVNTNYRI
jgi:hypothetical protein